MEFIEAFSGHLVLKKTPSGDQSVDKHIIAKMGQLSVKDNVQIVVISKDKGYNPIISAIDNSKKKISRYPSIANFLHLPQSEEQKELLIQLSTAKISAPKADKSKKKKKKKKTEKKIPKLSTQQRAHLNSQLFSSISVYKKTQKIEADTGWMVKNIFKHLEDKKPFTSIQKAIKVKGKAYEEIYCQIIEPILMEI